MGGPLQGIRVLEWGVWHQGPHAAAILGDLGADVIKIEDKAGDPERGLRRERGISLELPGGRNALFELSNRSKRGITLDLKQERGKEVLYRLVKTADVFIQNYRPGAAQRLGLDYPTLSGLNPRLIYASATGFGQKGPHRSLPALDLLAVGRSGLASLVSDPRTIPLRAMGGLPDQVGAIVLALGVLAALVARERLGVGQELDSSLLGSTLYLEAMILAINLLTGKPYAVVPRERAANPLYNHYRCRDGTWLVLGMVQSDRHWPLCCQALGLAHLEKDPRFATALAREKNSAELVAILDGVFASRSQEEWMALFQERGLWASPVNPSLLDLPQDPQVVANEYIFDFPHPTLGPVKFVGLPVKFSRTPGQIQCPAPELGQHTEEVLLEAGYTWEEIQELKEAQVI